MRINKLTTWVTHTVNLNSNNLLVILANDCPNKANAVWRPMGIWKVKIRCCAKNIQLRGEENGLCLLILKLQRRLLVSPVYDFFWHKKPLCHVSAGIRHAVSAESLQLNLCIKTEQKSLAEIPWGFSVGEYFVWQQMRNIVLTL